MLALHNRSFELMADITSIQVVNTIRDARKRQISAASGMIRFPKINKDVHFESSVERDFLLCCRLDPQIVNVIDQPFSIRYVSSDNPKPKHYTPDFMIEKDFELPEGQCAIGSASTRFTVFEVKRERDLKRNKTLNALKFAVGYKWAGHSADRSFSVMTDNELFGDFGKYFRLMSGLSMLPHDEVCQRIEFMFHRAGGYPNVGQIVDELTAKGISKSDAHNAIWTMIGKSILQPVKLGDLKTDDTLDYDPRHSGGYFEQKI